MPIFRCDECGCVENTALSHFWEADSEQRPNRLCSACDPDIAQWHGEFPRVEWKKSIHEKHSGMPPNILKRWKSQQARREAVAQEDE